MDNRTPCDKLAETCDKDSVRLDLAAIGTDRNDDNRLEPTLEKFKKDGKYPEFLAWWLDYGPEGKQSWSKEANIDWINTLIKNGMPRVLVAHKDAELWMQNKGRTTGNTWMEVKMLKDAGYKWDMDYPFPALYKATLLSSVKSVDEDLVETIANLKVGGDDAEMVPDQGADKVADKVADKDAEEEEEGSDKE